MEEQEAMDFLRNMEPQTMIFMRVEEIEGGPLETAFIVREESKELKDLSSTPVMMFSAGVTQIRNVFIIPCILYVPDIGGMYECFFNYYSTSNEPRYSMMDLMQQNSIVVVFIGDTGEPEREIEINNRMKSFFWMALSGLENRPPWTMGEFKQAKAELQNAYTIEQLFQHFRKGGGKLNPRRRR